MLLAVSDATPAVPVFVAAMLAVNGDAAATQGIGIMTEARWNHTYDFLVKADLLKASTDWRKAFTLDYVKDLHIMMA